MSTENVENVEQKEVLQNEEPKEEFVSKKAYTEVSSDMHKYKDQLKESKALLNQLQAERDSEKSSQMAEQGRFEELYKNAQSEMETMRAERTTEHSKFIDSHKKNSLLQQLGGFKKDEYNNFINTESIELNEDGSVNQDSMTAEIDRIKQTYPELLKLGTSEKLPNSAPEQNRTGDTSYSEMTPDQKLMLKKQLLKRPEGF